MKNNKTHTPKLRFPEFTGDWEEKKLGDFAIFFKGKGLAKINIVANGKYPCIHYGELFTTYSEVINNIISYTDLTNGFYSLANDVLMPTSDVTPNGLAKASCVNLNNVLLGGDILVIRTNKKIFNGEFLSRLIRYREREVLKYVSGTTVYHLYASAIEKMQLQFPTLPEQQKIASCLSSLDERIEAENQKLQALKKHKKGLMQQLFPAQGKVKTGHALSQQPKLRFKGFKGDWEYRKLGDVAKYGFSNGVFNNPKKVGSGYRLINVIHMYSDTPIKENELSLLNLNEKVFLKNKVEFGDIFFTRSSIVPDGIAHSNIYLGIASDITFDGHLVRLRPDTDAVIPFFLHFLLKSYFVRKQLISKGKVATMTTIGQSDIGSTIVFIPISKKEQQKIASCLSSLDEIIELQGKKIEKLQAHKKGLMQQMFPNPE